MIDMENSNAQQIGVLFVCLGNICRSPTSEGVFRNLAGVRQPELAIRVDSAGTAGYHIGHPPDQRAIAAAAKRGVDIAHLRARRISRLDFDRFDYVVGMDFQNYRDLKSMAPADYRGKICLFMDFAANWETREVPDPYYGDVHGFEQALDMIEDASAGLIEDIVGRGFTS